MLVFNSTYCEPQSKEITYALRGEKWEAAYNLWHCTLNNLHSGAVNILIVFIRHIRKSEGYFYVAEKLANINRTVLLSNNKSNKHDYSLPDRSNFPLKACSVKACFKF